MKQIQTNEENEQIVRTVTPIGNGAHVFATKEWLGKQVKIILIDRSNNIKKEVLEILSPYLHDIRGIYLTGSYARGEQEKDSDIDIIAISDSTGKNISSGKYNIEIYTIKEVISNLTKAPLWIYPRFREAKAIMNESLLENIKAIKINHSSWKHYAKECKKAIKSNKELMELDKKLGDTASDSVIYSLILRLRGIFLLDSILNDMAYNKYKFKKWIIKETGVSEAEFQEVYNTYKNIRDNKKTKKHVKINVAEIFLLLLEKEVKKIGKKKKTP